MTHRDRVAEVIKDRWMTVDALVEELGLTRKQIHGALSPNDNLRQFQKRRKPGLSDGTMEYHLKE